MLGSGTAQNERVGPWDLTPHCLLPAREAVMLEVVVKRVRSHGDITRRKDGIVSEHAYWIFEKRSRACRTWQQQWSLCDRIEIFPIWVSTYLSAVAVGTTFGAILRYVHMYFICTLPLPQIEMDEYNAVQGLRPEVISYWMTMSVIGYSQMKRLFTVYRFTWFYKGKDQVFEVHLWLRGDGHREGLRWYKIIVYVCTCTYILYCRRVET